MPSRFVFSSAILATFSALVAASPCAAQSAGYITGASSISSFSPATGAIVRTFSTVSNEQGSVIAVASDDSTLYLPYADELNLISGQTGKILSDVAFSGPPKKAILSGDGATAYTVAYPAADGQILVVDTATLSVTGSLTVTSDLGSTLYDLAVSPDGSTIYASLECLSDFCSAQYRQPNAVATPPGFGARAHTGPHGL